MAPRMRGRARGGWPAESVVGASGDALTPALSQGAREAWFALWAPSFALPDCMALDALVGPREGEDVASDGDTELLAGLHRRRREEADAELGAAGETNRDQLVVAKILHRL